MKWTTASRQIAVIPRRRGDQSPVALGRSVRAVADVTQMASCLMKGCSIGLKSVNSVPTISPNVGWKPMRPIATQEASRQSGRPLQTLSQAIVETLSDLGVRHAFGVSGGAIASLWGALTDSDIKVAHFRHETGAAFAAIEAHFVTNAPMVVFTTTGPGLTNALTGMLAARGEAPKSSWCRPAPPPPTVADGRSRKPTTTRCHSV